MTSQNIDLSSWDTLYKGKKVKWSTYSPGVARRLGTTIALLSHDRGTGRGEWSAARLGRTLPPGKARYPFYGRLGGPQGWSGGAENLVPTGIWSRTSSPYSVAIPTELPGPHTYIHTYTHTYIYINIWSTANLLYSTAVGRYLIWFAFHRLADYV